MLGPVVDLFCFLFANCFLSSSGSKLGEGVEVRVQGSSFRVLSWFFRESHHQGFSLVVPLILVGLHVTASWAPGQWIISRLLLESKTQENLTPL